MLKYNCDDFNTGSIFKNCRKGRGISAKKFKKAHTVSNDFELSYNDLRLSSMLYDNWSGCFSHKAVIGI